MECVCTCVGECGVLYRTIYARVVCLWTYIERIYACVECELYVSAYVKISQQGKVYTHTDHIKYIHIFHICITGLEHIYFSSTTLLI